MAGSHKITLIEGDGIGPEVIGATRRVIEAAGVNIDWEVCEAGAKVFKAGLSTGVPEETVDSLVRNRVALKGPLETPVGYGEKSANVTLRKMFDTYGNIRPIQEIAGVPSPYSGRGIDMVIVRENVEDLYAGIEYMQTPGTAQCLKLVSRKGCEKIVRLAFEFARSEGRKVIHCATKANIMKLTEGLMKRTFEEVASEYPDLEAHHIIVDNCAHQMVKNPEQFDVIVTTNMNGDILSDLGSALVGGLGFAPGANLGNQFAIFEAVHGSAPRYTGKNTINPTAVLLSGVMMLRFLKEFKAASLIEQALYQTLGVDKTWTQDVCGNEGAVSTTRFTDAIISNLGKPYSGHEVRTYKPLVLPQVSAAPDFVKTGQRSLKGVDIFIESALTPEMLGKSLEEIAKGSAFLLESLSCRGVMVYPASVLQADSTDLFCCRFISDQENGGINDRQIYTLLERITPLYLWTHIEKLHIFDGVNAYSKGHGAA